MVWGHTTCEHVYIRQIVYDKIHRLIWLCWNCDISSIKYLLSHVDWKYSDHRHRLALVAEMLWMQTLRIRTYFLPPVRPATGDGERRTGGLIVDACEIKGPATAAREFGPVSWAEWADICWISGAKFLSKLTTQERGKAAGKTGERTTPGGYVWCTSFVVYPTTPRSSLCQR
jgi:hypothetical protein